VRVLSFKLFANISLPFYYGNIFIIIIIIIIWGMKKLRKKNSNIYRVSIKIG